ncbi:MAG TPA: polyhydroxyalkanoate synthesis regulator DNA-binding domain-containing protein [Chloroflexota bacterium]|nr:polyhydroxyalkanoate synthesis regulator DNA-binding domain-containing protein [Chloroflexota bacterium]HUM69406.1 polyhydroxyalkanoate synthesis regulator DNA-binding domain-containing protein [Chloroflexota bacterium]
MRVIKRYPNRKLYDTEEKKYITLDGIADLIRQGEEVQVVDHTTDEDLTAVTLSQIIFEQEKRSSGFLPQSVLAGLVQSGGDTVNALRRTLTAPLGMLHHVDEEIEKRLQTLVNRGELAREDAARLRDKLLSIGTDVAESASPGQQIGRLFGARGVPSRDEVEQLTSQIEELSSRIDNLIEESDKSHPTQSPEPPS